MVKQANITQANTGQGFFRTAFFLIPHLRQHCITFALTAAIAAGCWPVTAQEQHFLALQTPGQASVAIDPETKTAYIVDLGRDGDGDKVEIRLLTPDGTLAKHGVPLLDALAEANIKHLNFTCSHPHSDHMGGILAIFKNPRGFFTDDALKVPRFESITVIDSGVTNSLYTILNSVLPKGAPIAVKSVSATNANAFADISKAENSVYVRTIPYTPQGKAGPHGRAVVTLTVLGGKHSILDFDDADSAVISQVVAKLKKQGIASIDTFVVPHHGSKYHDIEPVFTLGPKRAIITVNPRNRYGHPAPEILESLIPRLGAKNVLFTGSIENIVLGPEGVRNARYTAAMRDSYALFVLPNRLRAEKGKAAKKADIEAYDRVAKLMLSPGSPSSDSGPSAPKSNPATADLLRARIGAQGSILDPEFDLAYIKTGGMSAEELASYHTFGRPEYPVESPSSRGLYVTTKLGPKESSIGTPVNIDQSNARQRLLITYNDVQLSDSTAVEVRWDTEAGLENGTEPSRRVSKRDLAKPISRPNPTSGSTLPEGGMVYLTGGKLSTTGSAGVLLGGTVDICEDSLCIRTEGAVGSQAYTIPIRLDALLAEVWTRVYDRNIDAFYLSINPTKSFLRDIESRSKAIPSDRLQVGTDRATAKDAANEVVTAGDIERSRIGQILWQADVLFKSTALGFDVLAGKSSTAALGVNALPGGFQQSSEIDLAIDPEDRWCRLFWSSGSQQIIVDQTARRVRFRGDAVLAQAEAMTLHEGRLKSEPRGTWCADAKVLAMGLQKQANSSATKDDRIIQLRSIAQIQNFARWVRDNGIPISPGFRKTITEASNQEDLRIPRWTSGISSDPGVLVQLERSGTKEGTTQIVHVSFSTSDTLTGCILPEWKKQEVDFPPQGYKFNRVTDRWEGGIEQSEFLVKWMSGLAKRIKDCAHGRLLPANGVIPAEDTEENLEHTFGVALHVQAVHYHGGVLLGALRSRGFLETAWQTEGELRRPDGRLLFKRADEDLHFWNVLEDENEIGTVVHHAIINGGRVVDAYAANGKIRFLVEAQPGSIIRREIRAGAGKGFGKGLEWAMAQHARDGSILLEKAAWPCENIAAQGDECVQVIDMPESTLRERLGDRAETVSALRIELIEPSTWLVELDLAAVGKELDRRWETREIADMNAAFSIARTYANWGFDKIAETKTRDFITQLQGETEDTILAPSLLPKQEARIADLIASIDLAIDIGEVQNQLETRSIGPSTVVRLLTNLEKRVKKLTPDVSSLLWENMSEVCVAALGKIKATEKGRASIEEAKTRYEGLTKRNRALAHGSVAPLSEEPEDEEGDEWNSSLSFDSSEKQPRKR